MFSTYRGMCKAQTKASEPVEVQVNGLNDVFLEGQGGGTREREAGREKKRGMSKKGGRKGKERRKGEERREKEKRSLEIDLVDDFWQGGNLVSRGGGRGDQGANPLSRRRQPKKIIGPSPCIPLCGANFTPQWHSIVLCQAAKNRSSGVFYL